MDSKGEELFLSLKSMRNFLGDIGQLLSTADSLMGEKSWENIGGSGCLSEMSYSVNLGHLWMPREAVRTFKNEIDYPNMMAMIAVLLDDYKRDFKLQEPVVSAYYFVFPEKAAAEKLDFWQAHWFGWCEAPTDGTPIALDDSHTDWEPWCIWKYMEVFGRPLVEVTNETALKEKIVDPLVRLIQENAK